MSVSTAPSISDLASAVWRKSSRSGNGTNDSCVEVAELGQSVGVRDSKSKSAGLLLFSPACWSTFLHTLR